MDYNKLLHKLRSEKKLHLYGAGIISFGIYKALSELHGIFPVDFIVSDMKENVSKIDNIPVKMIEDMSNELRTELILVAVPEVYHKEIRTFFEEREYYNAIFIDSHLEYLIMSRYFVTKRGFKIIEQEAKCRWVLKGSVGFYMAKCHIDPPLKKQYSIPAWVIPVQAGAGLTNQNIAELRDDMGDNISCKNFSYSELTVTYWVWKNRTDEYKGIGHYRRMLRLSDLDIEKLKCSDIDVILPLPFVCYVDTSWQYGRYIDPEDVEVMWEVLHELREQEIERIEKVFKGTILYNYNMLIAKKDVFDAYCNWMFPILQRIEEIWEGRGVVRNDRYLGYIGEVLTSVYFMLHQNALKIVHAEKVWLI